MLTCDDCWLLLARVSSVSVLCFSLLSPPSPPLPACRHPNLIKLEAKAKEVCEARGQAGKARQGG